MITREKIIRVIEHLPYSKLDELMAFVQYLDQKSQRNAQSPTLSLSSTVTSFDEPHISSRRQHLNEDSNR